jgi:amino acid transporter
MDTPVDDISTIQVNAVLPSQGAIKDTLTSKLHSKYKTPYVAIIFLVSVSLIAPWLGRTALTNT